MGKKSGNVATTTVHPVATMFVCGVSMTQEFSSTHSLRNCLPRIGSNTPDKYKYVKFEISKQKQNQKANKMKVDL